MLTVRGIIFTFRWKQEFLLDCSGAISPWIPLPLGNNTLPSQSQKTTEPECPLNFTSPFHVLVQINSVMKPLAQAAPAGQLRSQKRGINPQPYHITCSCQKKCCSSLLVVAYWGSKGQQERDLKAETGLMPWHKGTHEYTQQSHLYCSSSCLKCK